MTLFQELLLYGCVALAAFFLLEWAIYTFGDQTSQGEKRIQRRLGRIKDNAEKASENLRRQSLGGRPEDMGVDKYFRQLILNADSDLTLRRTYMIIAMVTISIVLVLTLLMPIIPFIVRVFFAVVIGFGLPVVVLKAQAQSRIDKFAEQFPEAIEQIVRSLRVGQPLNIAMQSVGKDMPDPVGKEFDLVAQEISYGKDVPEALKSMLDRVGLQDLRFFVVAIQIQHESGGNLAEVLEGLSKIIRGRFRLMRKVKALTAEGRFSAMFLSAFPVVMIFVMNVVSPGYYEKVMDFEYFNHLAVLMFVMLIVNVIVMRFITTVKV